LSLRLSRSGPACAAFQVQVVFSTTLHYGAVPVKSFSAADANRNFSSVLRQVREGQTVVVTSRGKAVALVAPVKGRQLERLKARRSLLKRLRAQRATGARNWVRGDLYESRR
jgi:prevent-host-death family protein